MCKDGRFSCLRAFDHIYEMLGNNPNAPWIWLEAYPCMISCKQFQDLIKALETVVNLEEMEMLQKMRGGG